MVVGTPNVDDFVVTSLKQYEQALIKQLSRYADMLKNAALNYINTLIGFISKSNSLIDLKPLILMCDKLSIV
jgi:hypothetical protein